MTVNVFAETEKNRVRHHADKVLSSAYFCNSPRQQRFLGYLVSRSLDDEADGLKGYTIGIEVFDKEADFDPTVDAIVRVEATRIRNKLHDYYLNEGATDEVRIHFRKGTYKLEFTLQAQPANQAFIEPAAVATVEVNKPSLVVLPFISINHDDSRDYFADGMTDSLISLLSRLSGLFTISRQSAFAYKNTMKTAKEISSELGVAYLLEGSIQHAGDRVRVAAQLVSASDSRHVWSERYDCELGDIFALQDEITQQIANALQVQLTVEEDKLFGLKATSSIEAYDTLLRGMATFLTYTPETTKAAIKLFSKVIALDPKYAAAYAWLARALAFTWSMHWDRTPSILDSGLYYAKMALDLAPDSPYANSIMGWVLMWRLEIDESIRYGKKAVAHDPNNVEALLFLSMTLSSAGYGEEALLHIEHALRLTPTSSAFYEYALGNSLYVLKEYEKALAAYERGIQHNFNFLPNHYGQVCSLDRLNRQQDVIDKLDNYEHVEALIRLTDNPVWVDTLLLTEAAEIKKRFF